MLQKCDKKIEEEFPGQEEVDFNAACEVTESVPKPELETPPRRTRKERKSAETSSEPVEEGFINIPEALEEEIHTQTAAPEEDVAPTRTRRTRRTRQ